MGSPGAGPLRGTVTRRRRPLQEIPMSSARPTLGVGLIGYAFMGAAHSQAWRTAHRFFHLPLLPEMTVLAGRNAAKVTEAAERLGWNSVETDWRRVIERDDVQLV